MTRTDSDDSPRRYRIEVSDTAVLEADAIYLWIGQGDPERADRWYRELQKVYEGLEIFPSRNIALSDQPHVHRTLHGQYRVVYLVIEPSDDESEGTVRILRVVHGSRQLESYFS